MARFNMTYHGSPFAKSIMNQGFRPGGIMSVAPGKVFSTPNYGFASGYGKPVGMVTSKGAFSMPSMNFSTGNLGSEVVQSPKAATRGMNLANKLGTTYTSPRAEALMAGKTVSGLGGSTPGNFLKALGIMGSLPAQAALMTLSPTRANADEINMGPEDFANLAAAEDVIASAAFNTANEPLDIEDFLGTRVPENVIIGEAPSVFDINTMGDPALNAASINVEGSDPYGEAVSTGRPNMRDVAGDINENLIDRGNPYNDPRVVSEEQSLVGGITDRGRGMAAPEEMEAYEMIGGTPVAIGDVLGRQQALEKADFYEPSRKKGIGFDDLLGLAALAYTGPYKGAVKAGTMLNNLRTGKLNQVLGKAKGIPAAFAKKMRGVNPITGRANTQAQWEQQREERRQQNRTDNMIDRITKGKRTRSNPRDAGTTKAQKDAISAAIQDAARTRQYDKGGNQGSGGQSKIVCTMMNERYGFGSFRNKIWMKFHENHGPEYQKGYHTIFLPLVKIAKGEGKLNTAVRKVLEHMGRHVTADMFKIMKGKKRDTLGRIYRAIFEPTCRIIGKIKSALGRG